MIRLLLKALFSRLLATASGVLSFAREKPHLAAIIALAGLCGLLTWRMNHVLDQRDQARAQIERMVKDARRAVAASKRLEKASKELANAVDVKHKRSLADAMSAAGHYIDTHRVRGSCPVSAATAKADAAGIIDRSSEAPELVAVSPDDIRICTENTVRLEDAMDWAIRDQALQDSMGSVTP